jgi:hypothetical protein
MCGGFVFCLFVCLCVCLFFMLRSDCFVRVTDFFLLLFVSEGTAEAQFLQMSFPVSSYLFPLIVRFGFLFVFPHYWETANEHVARVSHIVRSLMCLECLLYFLFLVLSMA